MNLDNLRAKAEAAPYRLLELFHGLARVPSERNACYLAGYVTALQHAGQLDSEAARFWRSLVNEVEHGQVNRQTLLRYLPPST